METYKCKIVTNGYFSAKLEYTIIDVYVSDDPLDPLTLIFKLIYVDKVINYYRRKENKYEPIIRGITFTYKLVDMEVKVTTDLINSIVNSTLRHIEILKNSDNSAEVANSKAILDNIYYRENTLSGKYSSLEDIANNEIYSMNIRANLTVEYLTSKLKNAY